MVYVMFDLYVYSVLLVLVSGDWGQLNKLLHEDGDRIQPSKLCVLNKKQDGGGETPVLLSPLERASLNQWTSD
jgi:hypothetical protein